MHLTWGRRFSLILGVAFAVLIFAPLAVLAQSYPTRPITMIVPFAPGGETEFLARIIVEPMREFLGQPIIIENVGGADGSIGTGRAARAAANGYTIEFGYLGTHVMNAALYPLPYDVFADFAPISLVSRSAPLLFGSKRIPATDLDGLIAWLKANPEKGTAAAYTSGSRMLNYIFGKQVDTQLTFVPYRGLGPATQDLVAGEINLLFGTPGAVMPQERAGRIRVYATTGEKRLPVAPDVPTFTEKGMRSLSYAPWYAIFAPADTPPEIIGKLNSATVAALTNSSVKAHFAEIGHEIFPADMLTPEALATLQRSDAERLLPIMKEANIRAE